MHINQIRISFRGLSNKPENAAKRLFPISKEIPLQIVNERVESNVEDSYIHQLKTREFLGAEFLGENLK